MCTKGFYSLHSRRKGMVDNPFSDTTTEKEETKTERKVKRDAYGNVIEAKEKVEAKAD